MRYNEKKMKTISTINIFNDIFSLFFVILCYLLNIGSTLTVSIWFVSVHARNLILVSVVNKIDQMGFISQNGFAMPILP